jgi:hypothetical protein
MDKWVDKEGSMERFPMPQVRVQGVHQCLMRMSQADIALTLRKIWTCLGIKGGVIFGVRSSCGRVDLMLFSLIVGVSLLHLGHLWMRPACWEISA